MYIIVLSRKCKIHDVQMTNTRCTNDNFLSKSIDEIKEKICDRGDELSL